MNFWERVDDLLDRNDINKLVTFNGYYSANLTIFLQSNVSNQAFRCK